MRDEHVRLLAERARDLIFRYELLPVPGFSYVSPAVTRITGYTPAEHYAEPDLVRRLLHPDDLARLLALLQTPASADDPIALRWRHRDGSVRWTEARITPIDDAEGRLVAIEGVARDATARTEAEAAPQASDDRSHDLVEHSRDLVCTHDLDGRILSVNPWAARVLGYEPDALIGSNIRDGLAPEVRHEFDDYLRRIRRDGVADGLMVVLTSGGERRIWEYHNTLRTEGVPAPIVYGMARDLTAQIRAEHALRASEARLRSYLRHVSDLVTVFNLDGTIRYQSPSAERVLGYRPEELVGTNPGVLVHPDDRGRLQRVIDEVRGTPGVLPPIEVRVRHRDGSWRYLELIADNRFDDPEVTGWVLTSRDVSERKLLEEQLRRRAFYDTVTGLPNRALFYDRLRQAVAELRRGEGGVAVLFVDLDGFKAVNDRFGHQAGDRLLAAVGERLQACVRPGDTVARFGGDEFTLLLRKVAHVADARQLAERVTDVFRQPFTIDDRDMVMTMSVGLTVRTAATTQLPPPPDVLLWQADLALHEAKATGKDRVVLFRSDTSSPSLERVALARDLHDALRRGALELRYQPEVDLRTGAIVGTEALVRWRDPNRGPIPPDQFIPVAEETGLIHPLGEWALRAACRQALAWDRLRLGSPPPVMSVNLSPLQFHDHDLAAVVAGILNETGLPAERLRLEITESVLMEDIPATEETLRRLRGLGVRLAIDDFGTGYSSLSYLRRFTMHTLKIDRSFISGLVRDPGAEAILQAMVTVAHALGMDVTAEGIETSTQHAAARAAGCDRGQGFHFGRPQRSARIAALLRAGAAPSA